MHVAANAPYVLRNGTGVRELWWLAQARYSAKVEGEQTEGRLFQLHLVEPQGAAPPLHIHLDADESFYVIDGALTFYAGDERIEASAGDFVLVPKGTPHSFLVRSEQAELFVTLAPAGAEGFFAELGIPVVPGEPPAQVTADPEEFARRAAAYVIEIVGPPPTLD